MGIIIILSKVVRVCGGWVVVSCARFLLVVLVRRRVHAHDNAFKCIQMNIRNGR